MSYIIASEEEIPPVACTDADVADCARTVGIVTVPGLVPLGADWEPERQAEDADGSSSSEKVLGYAEMEKNNEMISRHVYSRLIIVKNETQLNLESGEESSKI